MNSPRLSKRLSKARNPRGTATVEMAVLMIVLIPTILYTMHLQDLLIFKFDLEETVVSTPFDLNNADFRKNDGDKIAGNARTAAMKTFWDHSSAWNSYDDERFDADDQKHHGGDMAAHECWLAQGGEEINCSMDSKVGLLIQPTFIMKNHGGLMACKAILGVQNYFLPNKFFQWWGKVGITGDGNQKMKRHASSATDIHGEAKSDPYLYPEMKFGVVHDSWALYKTKAIDPTMHPLEITSEWTQWVAIPYGLRAGKLKDANKFADDAVQKEILGNQVKIDGFGDTLITPPLAWKPAADRKVNGHYTSAWSDSRHQSTQRGMTNNYMGVAETTW